eukprot:jgi/Botrbrau1/10503/Bobra.0133s0103.1
MMFPFWGPLKLRFLSATVVVCLLSLSWLQASTEDQAVAFSQEAPGTPGHPKRQFWTQPRPPEDDPVQETHFARSLTGMAGRRGLRARHGINRLRKVASMGKQWMQLHRKLCEEVASADTSSGWDVIFLGDSITESWRGTFMGMSWGAFKRIPPVWDEHFEKYNAHVLAISGDQTSHLMWRIMNGELPRKKHPKVIVLHTGTNDLSGQACGSPETVNTTTLRITEMVKYLKVQYQRAHIVVISILPKGEGWPNLCTPIIGSINRGLRAFSDRTPGVTFLDPGQLFLKKLEAPKKGWEVNELLMSDSIHPTEKGMRILAAQIEPVVRKVLEDPTS